MKALAVVQRADRLVELAELPVPAIAPDQALLAVEGCGLCGTDVEQYGGALASAGVLAYPAIPGHEFVGRIERVGELAAGRMGLAPGDRVAVEAYLSCGTCRRCLDGRRAFCAQMRCYGLTPTTVEPGLWGGYSQYVVLQPGTVVHRVPDHLSVEDAVLFNPIGAGYDWAVRAAGTEVGDTVVVIGAGQRGLACVLAAAEAGARVILAGRGRRPWVLDLARRWGAEHCVNTERDDLAGSVAELTGGEGADRVVDTSHHSTASLVSAVATVRPGGTVIAAGYKGTDGIPGLRPDDLYLKALTVRGVNGVSGWAKEQAIRTVASGRVTFDGYHSHTFPLDRADEALRTLAGEVEGEDPLHITLVA